MKKNETFELRYSLS